MRQEGGGCQRSAKTFGSVQNGTKWDEFRIRSIFNLAVRTTYADDSPPRPIFGAGIRVHLCLFVVRPTPFPHSGSAPALALPRDPTADGSRNRFVCESVL